MASVTLSTRLEPEEVELLDSLAEISGFDRSTLVKVLLRKGVKELRMELASEAYCSGHVTLSRGAEMAGVRQWDFLSRMEDKNLNLHYDVEDFEQDLKAMDAMP